MAPVLWRHVVQWQYVAFRGRGLPGELEDGTLVVKVFVLHRHCMVSSIVDVVDVVVRDGGRSDAILVVELL